MNPTHGYDPDQLMLEMISAIEFINTLRSRIPSVQIMRVTNNKDDEGLRRLKAKPHWGQDEEEGDPLETDWIQDASRRHAGPTNTDRGHVWGENPPLPEIGQLIVVVANNDDPHDLWWTSVAGYGAGNPAVPDFDKDDHRDWSWREVFKGGGHWGWDTEGNFVHCIPGNYVLKVGGSATIEVRGVFKLIALYIGFIAITVLRRLAAKFDDDNAPRPDEQATIDKLMMEMARPVARVKEDPGIGKIDWLED